MSENTNQPLNQCLRAVWRREQRKHAVGGLLAFARWFIPLFAVIILIDRLAFFPAWLRAIAALALLVVALRQAWRHGWCRLRGFDATRTAMQIESAHGGMDSLLATAVHFEKRGATPGTSAALWEFTQRKAQAAAGNIQPEKVVTMGDLKRPLYIAMAIVAVLLLVAILNGPFLAAGLGRLFTPWLAIAYPTDTKIELGTAELVVKEGAPAKVEIRLSGKVPKTAKLALQTGQGQPREIDLNVIDGLATYELASASRDFSFRVKAGDARSDWHQVRVISAPRLASVNLELDFPDYIDRANEQVEALTLTVPEETKVRWQLTLDTPIRTATLHRDGEGDLPLEIGADGRSLTLTETASASRGYSFSWIEAGHGFDFESPRYFLQVASDQAPRIELTAPVANITAMLNRPMKLAVRAQDDHGIGTNSIIYRVNRRPEKTITLASPLRNGEGEQKIDWDYRKELPDLIVGDSVSFLVEIADKYPGETGPHRVRTDTRRITFLSREDYLAEINKQVNRLLTRVRTIYRQQRAAHELALSLDPMADSFIPTCQLEAIRQEMVREQLVTTAAEVQALLDDLAANQASDAVESDSLAALRDALRAIATDHVARAADGMRAQVGTEKRDPQPAIAAINQSARELASLVLQRGIDASREVYARETGMLAGELTRLRLRLITATPEQSESLAKHAGDIATWTDKLLTQLTDGMRYESKPLAVLGLSRRIHDLRTTKVIESLGEVAAQAGKGETKQANDALYPLIRPLWEAGFTMRSGAEFALVRDLGEQLREWITQQENLLAELQSAGDFETKSSALATRQAALRDSLVLAAMSGIPAPRARLSDHTFPPQPPADERRLLAERLMHEAADHLQSRSKEQALSSQQNALAALRELNAIISHWAMELSQKTIGTSSQVSDATNRIGELEQFETRQIGLVEQTEELALNKKDSATLIAELQVLAEDVEAFRVEISGGNAGTPKDLLPMLGRVENATAAMSRAMTTLRAKQLEEALEPLEQAAEAFTEALTMAQEQLVKLNLQQQLIGFQQAVVNASNQMADVIGGQTDLVNATVKADEEKLKTLLPPQRNLHQCLSEIAPSLGLVAARLDVGTPLAFAASDVEDALATMEDGDAKDAAEIQETALDSLGKVRGKVSEIAVQTGYITEIVEFLHDLQSTGARLAFHQRQLREQAKPEDVIARQQALATDTKAYGEALNHVAGKINFETLSEKVKLMFEGMDLSLDGMAPATHMAEALSLIQAGQPATEAMQAAEKSFASHAQHMNVIVAMLNGLPGITVTKTQPPELHRLIAVLDTASKHRVLLRQTHGSADKDLPSLAASQQSLIEAITKASQFEGLSHTLLTEANSQMASIPAQLGASNKSAASAQLAVDQGLRHFIIEQALILNTAIPPSSGGSSEIPAESETNDLDFNEAVESISDFVSGETPKDKKSEWEILGTRNRAALNQNFARELPLEYRATLKDYYERVAK